MKIKQKKKLKNFVHASLKLKLIKIKTYKTKKLNKINDIEFKLKRILFIIYKYHKNNKQILFLNTPLNLDKKLQFILKNTKHAVLPNLLWIKGSISNRLSIKKNILRSKLKQKPDLIVLITNSSDTNKVLSEFLVNRIPIISLGYNEAANYKVPGNFKFTQKQRINNVFYSSLITVLKK